MQNIAMSKTPAKCATKKDGKGVVGLTDSLKKAMRQHHNPMGWTVEGPFLSERAAREWMQYYVGQGYAAATEDRGWRYGYRYPIVEPLVD
jgi:hypothetical protein